MDRKTNVVVGVFEDRYPVEGVARPEIPEGVVDWFRAAVFSLDLDVLPPEETGFAPDMRREIELLLCSRDTMECTFENDAMGIHIVDTPDGDPFGDETPYARRLRCAVVIDVEDIRARLRVEIQADGHSWSQHLPEYEESEAATAFHEIAHAVLFAANSGWVSPNEVELLHSAGDLNNDLFDHSSGYGMRPLPDEDGREVWADSAQHASYLMEDWCERQGRAWYRQAAAAACRGFYETIGIDPEAVAKEVRPEQESEMPLPG